MSMPVTAACGTVGVVGIVAATPPCPSTCSQSVLLESWRFGVMEPRHNVPGFETGKQRAPDKAASGDTALAVEKSHIFRNNQQQHLETS
jgi:hypothetical protein